MKVLLAENAGFCFGVKRAVDEAIKTQKQYNKKIYTLGPLIHNGDVVKSVDGNNYSLAMAAEGEQPNDYNLETQFDINLTVTQTD